MTNKLRTSVYLLIVVFVLFGLTSRQRSVNAQDKPQATPATYDIEAIYRAANDALNAGDNEGNLQYYADDAISIALPPPPGIDAITVGKEALRKWNADAIGSHSHIEFTDFHVNGETINVRTMSTNDFLKGIGVGYLEFSGTAIVRDGLIVSESFLMSKQSQQRLEAALTLQANKEIVRRFYDEVFSQGNMTTADEIMDPNFGASFVGDRKVTDADRGLVATKEYILAFRKSFPDLKIEATDMVAEGDIVVVNIRGSGTYQGGLPDPYTIPDSAIGKKITWYGTDYTRVVNGKMMEAWGTHEDLPYYEQLGMKLVPTTE